MGMYKVRDIPGGWVWVLKLLLILGNQAFFGYWVFGYDWVAKPDLGSLLFNNNNEDNNTYQSDECSWLAASTKQVRMPATSEVISVDDTSLKFDDDQWNDGMLLIAKP